MKLSCELNATFVTRLSELEILGVAKNKQHISGVEDILITNTGMELLVPVC